MRESDADLSAREHEDAERYDRIDRGDATDEDLAWQRRIVEEVVDMANSGTEQYMLDEEEAEDEEDRKAFEERRQQRDMFKQQYKAFRERMNRRLKGRATEADLDEGTWLSDKS